MGLIGSKVATRALSTGADADIRDALTSEDTMAERQEGPQFLEPAFQEPRLKQKRLPED